MDSTNYITAEIYVEKGDKIRVINSFEKAKREKGWKWKDRENEYKYKNEEEIKKCKIEFNGESIPFSYFYKFNQKGKYIIKYSFPTELTSLSSMFCDCIH